MVCETQPSKKIDPGKAAAAAASNKKILPYIGPLIVPF